MLGGVIGVSEPLTPAAAPNTLSAVTATEQLLLDTGFHPTPFRAFSDVDYDAVQDELHKQDLLGSLPYEDRNRRIGMLVVLLSSGSSRKQQADSSRRSAEPTESTDH